MKTLVIQPGRTYRVTGVVRDTSVPWATEQLCVSTGHVRASKLSGADATAASSGRPSGRTASHRA